MWFSELYLFIFQQIQLVMCFFLGGRQRKPGAEAGLMISGVALSDNAHTHVQDFHALSVHRHSHELLDRIGHSNCM